MISPDESVAAGTPAATTHTGALDIHLVNVPTADAQFIRNVVNLFTDPHFASHVQGLRNGATVILYEPGGGLSVNPWQGYNPHRLGGVKR